MATTIIVDGVTYPATDAGIISAINDLPSEGGIVYLPDGTYNISNSIKFSKNNVIIEGESQSAILYQVNNTNLDSIIYDYTANGITVKNLKIDGNKANQTSGIGYGIYDYEWTPNNCFTVQNVLIVNTKGHGIFSGSSDGVIIIGCTIIDSGDCGIKIYANTNNWSITNNTISGSVNSGIDAEGTSGNGCPEIFTISGNTISDVKTDQKSGIHLFGVYSGSIYNNIVKDNTNASHGINGIFVSGNDITIYNNDVSDVSGVGIETNARWTDDKGSADSYIVYNNTIFLIGSGSDANGIWASGNNSHYYNNIIENATQYGIYQPGGKTNTIIEKNLIKNCKNNRAGIVSGIGGGTSTNIVIKNNVIYDDQVIKTQRDGIYCLTANFSNLRILNNTIYGVTNGIYINTTGDAYLRNNIINNCSSKYIFTNTITLDSDYNSLYPEATEFISYNGITYNSLSAYQVATGQDLHSIAADPMLNADYTLQAGSPCIDAGVYLADVLTDYNGRIRGSTPDIGALQYSMMPKDIVDLEYQKFDSAGAVNGVIVE